MVEGTRVPFTASARWKEYVQEKDEYEDSRKTGKKVPAAMWAKMPYLMLGKVAEALALRKAFPNDLSGIYTHEEMQQADIQVEAMPEQPTSYRVERVEPATSGDGGSDEHDRNEEPPVDGVTHQKTEMMRLLKALGYDFKKGQRAEAVERIKALTGEDMKEENYEEIIDKLKVLVSEKKDAA
jgi:hypothetical protein